MGIAFPRSEGARSLSSQFSQLDRLLGERMTGRNINLNLLEKAMSGPDPTPCYTLQAWGLGIKMSGSLSAGDSPRRLGGKEELPLPPAKQDSRYLAPVCDLLQAP